MERKKITQKMKLLLVLVVSMLINQSVWATDIVNFSLSSNGNSTGGLSVNTATTMTISGITSSSYSGTNGQTCYGWNALGSDRWQTTSFSTAGYIQLTVQGQMKATSTGPRDFIGQYSLNGTTWTDIPNDPNYSDDDPLITLVTSNPSYALKGFKFRLPTTCDNKATVYVRWVQNGTVNPDGGAIGTNSSASASLKGVSVQGEAFAAPTSQASVISIVSVTPTTITVGCTPGAGNRRIIVMNTVNSFTNPVDDYNPSANTTYNSGEQVIYNGSGSQVTVTVPSSTNVYWFRYYDYNIMDNLTRYNISTATANPKQCKLETIHSPTSIFGLTRATLGATIATPTTGTITERGIFWSYSPNVDTGGNQLNESTTQGGVFTLDIPDGVDRRSTVYYKGYVTNESGTILTSEASFNNTPIFTGTGTWETPARWNVQEVPGANGDATYGSVDDSPIIRGNCTLGTSNSVTDLTIESGKLTINKATSLNVTGAITNSVGSAGILLKSRTVSDVDATGGLDSQYANGSLIFGSGSPSATVEMYSKANWNLSNAVNNKYKWQFFTIPVKTMTAGSTFNFSSCYVREWDESVITDLGGIWVKRNDGSTLYHSAGTTMTNDNGFEVVQASPKVYTFTGALQDEDFVKTLSYHADAAYPGQNIMGNPFTAAVNIDQIQFGDAEKVIYQYNAGTYSDWSNIGGATVGTYGTAITPGRYTVSTPNTAGTLGTLRQIPPMQGFAVKTTVNGGTFTIPKSALVGSTTQQRVQGSTATTKVATRIDVVGTTFADCMWIFSDPTCSRSFDNGWDARKLGDIAQVSQIYAIEADGNYQIDAVNDINNSYIGFEPGDDTRFKLIFNHQGLDQNYSKLYLTDLATNSTVDITASGSEYVFTGTATDAVKRFKISSVPITPTGLNKNTDGLKLTIYSCKNSIYINNTTNELGKMSIFDNTGHCLQISSLDRNKQTVINTNLTKGAYIVTIKTNSEKVTKSIIIN